MANHLAFLNMDLTDPEFHGHALAQARAFGSELTAVLDDAVAAGELATRDTARLARLVQAVFTGALLAWAIHREGTARDWVRRDLEALLEPYLSRRRHAPARRNSRRD